MCYTSKELKKMVRYYNGEEIIINDVLRLGCGIYADTADVLSAGVPKKHILKSPNPLFKRLSPTGADKIIDFLYEKDGYLTGDNAP